MDEISRGNGRTNTEAVAVVQPKDHLKSHHQAATTDAGHEGVRHELPEMEAAPLHVAVENKGRPAKLSPMWRYTYSLAGSEMLVSENWGA
jgi:hypothetical protein